MVQATLTATLENAISMAEAARLCHCHVASTWRHATTGVGDVKLQTWRVGGKRMTTVEAVETFLLALNADNPAQQPAPGAARARRERQAAAAMTALRGAK